jgi:hypothetical protein
MRHDAPFIVKRRAPMIGRPDSTPRITVAYQAYQLEAALDWCRRDVETHNRYVTRFGVEANTWSRCSALWIEHRGQPATRKGARS